MQLIHLNDQILGIVIVETSAKVYKARYTVLKEGMSPVSIPAKPERYHVECYRGKKMVALLTRNTISEANYDARNFSESRVQS